MLKEMASSQSGLDLTSRLVSINIENRRQNYEENRNCVVSTPF